MHTQNATRRDLLHGAAGVGLGLAGGAALFEARAATGISNGAGRGWMTQEASPAAGLTAAGRPAFGTEDQVRGEGGELRIIQWQAATMANAQASVGTKDLLIAALVQEPLMSYLPDGSISPTLVTAVPTVENGLLAADLSTVTFVLREAIT